MKITAQHANSFSLGVFAENCQAANARRMGVLQKVAEEVTRSFDRIKIITEKLQRPVITHRPEQDPEAREWMERCALSILHPVIYELPPSPNAVLRQRVAELEAVVAEQGEAQQAEFAAMRLQLPRPKSRLED